MVIVRPFKGLRPPKEIVKKLASRPYDVMNSEEARKEAERREKEEAEAAERQLQEAERLKKEQEAEAAEESTISNPESSDFTANNKNNIWDSIEKPEPEEDLDIPPSLRSRLKR